MGNKTLTLEEALKECLMDDHKVSKYEAEVLHDLILADGKITPTERDFLKNALKQNQFDAQASKILSELLLRAQS